MRKIVLDENEGVELLSRNGKLRLYVSLVDLPSDERYHHGYQVVCDKSFIIQPRSDNSIMVIPEPLSDAQAKRVAPLSNSEAKHED